MQTLTLKLTDRDRLIIAYALSLCPVAELGDRVGGHDGRTARRLVKLAALFDKDISEEMETFCFQFERQP